MTVAQKQRWSRPAGGRDRQPDRKRFLSSPLFLSLLLAVVTLGVYAGVFRNDFVDYDDGDYFKANPHVQGGLSRESIAWAFTTGHASNWHPVTWLSHILDAQLFGSRPGWQHLVSVGFHVVNSLLLFSLLRRMTQALWRSAIVAALFALHPLHVESVAWISERKDVLSGLFFLLTVLAYARWAECQVESKVQSPKSKVPAPEDRSRITHHASRLTPHSALWYALALVFFGLGLMSKPMLVTLPFVLVLLDYWPLGRFDEVQSSQFKVQSSSLARLLLEKVPFLALTAASSVVTFFVQRKGGAVSNVLSVWERIANALVSYGRYIRKMFWPFDLSVLYPHPGKWPAWEVMGCLVLLLVISGAVVVLGRKHRYLIMGWLWFLGMLVPVIGLVQVGIQSMADRYTYLPLIGLFVMAVWGISDAVEQRPGRLPALAIATGIVLAACAVLTFQQVGYWENTLTLFGRAVRVTSRNYLAWNNLGFYLANNGRAEEAIEKYQESLKINPSYEEALNNIGHALAGRRQYKEAIVFYERALAIKPLHPEVNNNYGNALSETGRIDDAITHYLITLKQRPDHADAHNNYGIALAMKGKLDEAIEQFHLAIKFKPNYASAHGNLGNAYAAQRKFGEAIREFEESLRLNPAESQTHNNLGNALAEQGRVDEAITHYTESLRLDANNPEAHFNLGLALLRRERREEARGHFAEALRLRPDYAAAQAQLNALAPGR
jgi:tetratricopeptide (TPR) repeat protein